MTDTSPPGAEAYNPNRLFDILLETFALEDDAALGRALHVGAHLIRRIRCGQMPVDALLLIRMNELSGIGVRELRRLMGDRRTECRATDVQVMPAPPVGERAAHRKPLEDNDAGLPNSVQWS